MCVLYRHQMVEYWHRLQLSKPCCLMGEGKHLSYCLRAYCTERQEKMFQSLAVWMHANICVNVCTMCALCFGVCRLCVHVLSVCVWEGESSSRKTPIREQNKAAEQEVKVCLTSAVPHRIKANKWYLLHR